MPFTPHEMTTQASAEARRVRPRQQAPDLQVPLAGGGEWHLAERQPDHFTMIVFYRGHHCPVCRKQLTELNRRIDEFNERGVDVIAISGDPAERAERSADEWKLDRLAIGYELSETAMREWGLFVSSAIKDTEPARFNEPGLFLIEPDQTVFFESIQSMPWGRPQIDDLVHAIDFVLEKNYPARGES